MISKKIGKDDPEFTLLMDWWKLRQNFYEVENTDDFHKFNDACNEIYGKYKNTPLQEECLKLLRILIDLVDEKWRQSGT